MARDYRSWLSKLISGPAELATGAKVIVTTHLEGMQLKWEAKLAAP